MSKILTSSFVFDISLRPVQMGGARAKAALCQWTHASGI